MNNEKDITNDELNETYQDTDFEESLSVLDGKFDSFTEETLAVDLDHEDYHDDSNEDHYDINDSVLKNGIPSHAVNLVVRCEIGMVNISLDKLSQLRVGDVIDLIRWPSVVKLTANGAYFAEGVLVEVDGMLGVKLTRKL